MQNTVHVMYELVDRRRARVELALRPSVNFRAQEAPVSEPLGWPYEFRAIGDRYEIALKDSPLPPLRLVLQASDVVVHAEGQADRQTCSIRSKRAAAIRRAATSGAPAITVSRLGEGERATLVASTEPFETMSVLRPEQALAAERERRRAAARRRRRPPRRRVGGRAGAGRRPVHHHAGRPHRGSGAGARLRRRGAHGHRRLSLVHRLGPRHDDQPRGADARDRPPRSRPATSCGPSRTTCATA